ADAVGEGLEAPRLDLGDLAAVLLDDALELLDERLDLLRRHILSRQKYVFVQWHICLSSCSTGAKPHRSLMGKAVRRSSRAETREAGSIPILRQAPPSVQPPAGVPSGRR